MEPAGSSERTHGITRADLEACLVAAVRSRATSVLTPDHLARLDDTELATTAARLLRLRQACGCLEGGVCMMGALLVGSLLALRRGASNLTEGIMLGAKVLGWVLVAAAVGKVVGMGVSRARWHVERGRLFRRLAGAPEGGGHVVLR
jgi:hypothetical protein